MSTQQKINFRSRNLIFVDIETTGLDFTKHEIIEIAYLVVSAKTFEVVSEHSFKIKPLHIELADPKALEINGYSDKEWGGAQSLRSVLIEFNNTASEGMLTGWNISFDWAFLEKAFMDLGVTPKFDYHRIDVMSIAFAMLYSKKEIEHLNLRKMAPIFGINLPETHGAMGDIEATYKLFTRLMKNEN